MIRPSGDEVPVLAHRVFSLPLEFGRYRDMADMAGRVVGSLLSRMTGADRLIIIAPVTFA